MNDNSYWINKQVKEIAFRKESYGLEANTFTEVLKVKQKIIAVNKTSIIKNILLMPLARYTGI